MKPMEQELKAMFGQTPESFNLAIDRALAGEKAERPAHGKPAPRRLSRVWSIVLIVALVLALTTGAYAAAVRLGLVDFVGGGYIGPIPQSALEVLQSTETQSWEVGPVTITLNETIADGHLVYVICQARMTDGSDALLYNWDCFEMRTPAVLKERLGLEGDWLALAAAGYDGVICSVQTRLELDPAVTSGDEMELDPAYGSDGSLLNAYMVSTDASTLGETVTGQLRVDVRLMQVNDAWLGEYSIHWDAEVREKWTEYFPVEIPVIGTLETKTYLPVEGGEFSWGTLERVDVERTPAGVYAYIRVLVTDPSVNMHRVGCGLRDENDEDLPGGIYPASGFDDSAWPEVTWMDYFGADELPETLMVHIDGESLRVR